MPGPHKNHVSFKRYMSLAVRASGTAWINKSEARNSWPQVSLLIGNERRRPRRTWKMDEMWRGGWGSMKIDYLTLCLKGSPGSVASFVPPGQFVEMTPEGKSWGLSSCPFDWEGQALLAADELTCHKDTHTPYVKPPAISGYSVTHMKIKSSSRVSILRINIFWRAIEGLLEIS